VAPAEPVAELTAAAGLGAIGAKLAATAVLGGAIVGGVAVAPSVRDERTTTPERAVADAAPSVATARAAPNDDPDPVLVAAQPERRPRTEQTADRPGTIRERRPAPSHTRRGHREDVAESGPQPQADDRRGHGPGRQDEPDHSGRGHSGPGGGDAPQPDDGGDESQNSGPSSGSRVEPVVEDDHSGPGSGSSGPSPSSGSGSGPSLSAGSGSSGPGGGDDADEELESSD
jgi:hypothetical protein